VLYKRYKNFSLAKCILVLRIVIDILYTYYYYLKLSYIILKASSYYRNYIKAKKIYNSVLIISSYKYFSFYFILKIINF
jgi:hypothetical protein